MSKRKQKQRLPSICLDQHINREIARAFRSVFRTIEVSQTASLRGRDEKDFLPNLYAQNAVFVTSDEAFVNHVLDEDLPHAGIVFIPRPMLADEKVLLAEVVGGFIQGACSGSRFALRRRVIYPGHDGLRSVSNGEDELEFSWDWLSQMTELP